MASDFLQTYGPMANDIATKTGLDPAVVLGIIDTETSGGQRVLSNNVFGISPGGKGGQYVAKYPDVAAGAEAFVKLMQQPRYAKVAASPDPAAQAQALVAAGYNTVDPGYAKKVGGRALQFGQQVGYQAPAAPAANDDAPAQGSAKAAALAGLDQQIATPPAGGQQAGTTAVAPAQGSAKAQALAALDQQIAATTPPSTGATSASPAPLVPPSDATAFDASIAPGTPSADGGPLGRIGSAIAEGYNTSPSLLEPAGKELVNKIPFLGPNVLTPWADVAGGLLGAAGHGMGAAGFEVGNALGGPRLGRDVNALLQVAPVAHAMPPTGRVPTPMAAATPAYAWEGIDPAMRARMEGMGLGPSPTRPRPSGPEGPGGGGGPGEGPAPGMGPRSAGAAATPAYEAIHTPQEEAAYRATAEGQKLLEPQVVGERDINEYIPGETVNNAEREQTAKAALELKALGIRVPEASDVAKGIIQDNNNLRVDYAKKTAGSPVDINNRRTLRETNINADKATVFAPENVTGPVDIKPVIADMEAVLNDPFNRQNTALKEAYKPWLDRLKSFEDGVIEDPREAWGLRYDIDQQTDKFAARDNPNMHRVAHHLADVADSIDTQIEPAAPGYRAMLDKYKEHSRAIDEMTVLQEQLKNLRGPNQTLNYNDFQRFMKDVANSRMTPATDLNPYKAISPENMERLWNLRDSLRRTASARELARAAGSDTASNLMELMKGTFKTAGAGGLHAVAGAVFGPGGNVAAQVLQNIIKTSTDRVLVRKATQEMQRLMNPSEPLRPPPGQENVLTGAPQP